MRAACKGPAQSPWPFLSMAALPRTRSLGSPEGETEAQRQGRRVPEAASGAWERERSGSWRRGLLQRITTSSAKKRAQLGSFPLEVRPTAWTHSTQLSRGGSGNLPVPEIRRHHRPSCTPRRTSREKEHGSVTGANAGPRLLREASPTDNLSSPAASLQDDVSWFPVS